MSPMLVKKRDKPTSQIYEDNYGYTINYYQPMIDYIDAKKHGAKPQYPHLPWTNERGLEKFRPGKLVRSYSNKDIKELSDKLSEQAKKDLLDQRVLKRSAFSVVQTAVASRVKKHIQEESVDKRTTRKIHDREVEIQKTQDMADMELAKMLKDFRDDRKEVKLSASLKQAIKGKSANGIRDALLAESNKNIKCSSYDSDVEVLESMRRRRGASEHRIVHVTMMDERETKQLDSTVHKSLEQVKHDLKMFNSKASSIFEDSRYCTI